MITQGKWEVKIWKYVHSTESKVMVQNKEHAIAEMVESYYPEGNVRQIAEANARLMAAAPELLVCVKQAYGLLISDYMKSKTDWCGAGKVLGPKFEQAIAKAENKE
ncbi:MAG: hypothetical protein MUO31_06695 [Thermodesulfovibrionales bacterium]|nr:hypothetical protein [Thermodesulfovibrionales bacterium]